MPYDLAAIQAAMQEQEVAKISTPTHSGGERIYNLPIEKLENFPENLHHFHPAEGQRLEDLKESIRENGILNPLLCRQVSEDRYQIIAGHNRRTAAAALGWETVPCILKSFVTDDEAVLAMNADNRLTRVLLPSERGWSYRQELEIRKRQGQRTDLTSVRSGQKLSRTVVAENNGVGNTQIQRYIRLTYLIQPLLSLVDKAQLGVSVGGQLSYLSDRSQEVVFDFCYCNRDKPLKLTEAQARKLREIEADPDNIIDWELLEELTARQKKVRFRTLNLEMKPLREYFPVGTPEEVVVQTIHAALCTYFEKRK